LTDVGGMTIRQWEAVMNELRQLFLQGYETGVHYEWVGWILLLLARYRAVES